MAISSDDVLNACFSQILDPNRQRFRIGEIALIEEEGVKVSILDTFMIRGKRYYKVVDDIDDYPDPCEMDIAQDKLVKFFGTVY